MATKLTRKSSKKRIIAAWVEALKSGEYKQAKNVLHKKGKGKKPDSFCCLGVLCDLAVKAKVISAPSIHEHVAYGTVYQYADDNTGVLPEEVMNWAGITDSTGDFEQNGNTVTLAELNDDGKKFTTIAKTIESNPEGLFV